MNLRGWLTALGTVVGLGVVAAAIAFLPNDDLGDGNPVTEGGITTTDYPGGHHTDDDVDYAQDPPQGGLHDDEPLKCGVYDRPVREENVVHTLEHGAVWIAYAPELPETDVSKLAALLPEKGVLSPREELPAPIVVTAWNAQANVAGVGDPRLQEFIDEYSDGHTAPEATVSCAGGVEEFDD